MSGSSVILGGLNFIIFGAATLLVVAGLRELARIPVCSFEVPLCTLSLLVGLGLLVKLLVHLIDEGGGPLRVQLGLMGTGLGLLVVGHLVGKVAGWRLERAAEGEPKWKGRLRG